MNSRSNRLVNIHRLRNKKKRAHKKSRTHTRIPRRFHIRALIKKSMYILSVPPHTCKICHSFYSLLWLWFSTHTHNTNKTGLSLTNAVYLHYEPARARAQAPPHRTPARSSWNTCVRVCVGLRCLHAASSMWVCKKKKMLLAHHGFNRPSSSSSFSSSTGSFGQ